MSVLYSDKKLGSSKIVYGLVEEAGDIECRTIKEFSAVKSFTIHIKDMIETEEKRFNETFYYSYRLPEEITKHYNGYFPIKLSLSPLLSEEFDKIKKEIQKLEEAREKLYNVESDHSVCKTPSDFKKELN